MARRKVKNAYRILFSMSRHLQYLVQMRAITSTGETSQGRSRGRLQFVKRVVSTHYIQRHSLQNGPANTCHPAASLSVAACWWYFILPGVTAAAGNCRAPVPALGEAGSAGREVETPPQTAGDSSQLCRAAAGRLRRASPRGKGEAVAGYSGALNWRWHLSRPWCSRVPSRQDCA